MGKFRSKPTGGTKVRSPLNLTSSLYNSSTNTNTPINSISRSTRITKVKTKLKKHGRISFNNNSDALESSNSKLVNLRQQQLSGGSGIRRFDAAIGERQTSDSLRSVLKNVPLKKTRKRMKKDEFKKRIQALQELEEQRKAALERAKTVIVGDLDPLLQALPEPPPPPPPESRTVPSRLSTASSQSSQQQQPQRKKLKIKRRQQEIAEGLEYFAAGLAAFRASRQERTTT